MCIYLQKTRTAGPTNKSFSTFFCKFDLPRKKLENNNFMGAALLCANISQIFFSTGSSKIFAAVYLRICSTGPLIFPHPSESLLEFQLILSKKSSTTEMGFNLYPNISRKGNWSTGRIFMKRHFCQIYYSFELNAKLNCSATFLIGYIYLSTLNKPSRYYF